MNELILVSFTHTLTVSSASLPCLRLRLVVGVTAAGVPGAELVDWRRRLVGVLGAEDTD